MREELNKAFDTTATFVFANSKIPENHVIVNFPTGETRLMQIHPVSNSFKDAVRKNDGVVNISFSDVDPQTGEREYHMYIATS